MTRRAGVVIALGLVLLIPRAHAQQSTFDQITRQCVADINQHLGRETKGDMWGGIARCAVARAYPSVRQERIDGCIKRIWDLRWQNDVCQQCGNPVLETAKCSLGMAF